MKNIGVTISKTMVSQNVNKRYNYYKNEIDRLRSDYDILLKESKEIAKVLEQMKDENLIDSHLTKLLMLAQGRSPAFFRGDDNQKKLDKITRYFQNVEQVSVKGLQLIFDIRHFFTGQQFEVYVEHEGKIFSFSIEDVEKYIGGIIPVYTDSLEKYINNINNSTRAVAPELYKLSFSLTALNQDLNEIKGIQSYLDFVDEHLKDHKIEMPENRKLEAAIYLQTRNPDPDFNLKSDRSSLHSTLGWYIKHGGTSDTITMYKIGDTIQKTEEGFKNIEIKMHSGTISLNMIANGIKKLYEAFNSETPEEKFIKFFNVNPKQLSNPIEREAVNETLKHIKEVFKDIN